MTHIIRLAFFLEKEGWQGTRGAILAGQTLGRLKTDYPMFPSTRPPDVIIYNNIILVLNMAAGIRELQHIASIHYVYLLLYLIVRQRT